MVMFYCHNSMKNRTLNTVTYEIKVNRTQQSKWIQFERFFAFVSIQHFSRLAGGHFTSSRKSLLFCRNDVTKVALMSKNGTILRKIHDFHRVTDILSRKKDKNIANLRVIGNSCMPDKSSQACHLWANLEFGRKWKKICEDGVNKLF